MVPILCLYVFNNVSKSLFVGVFLYRDMVFLIFIFIISVLFFVSIRLATVFISSVSNIYIKIFIIQHSISFCVSLSIDIVHSFLK